MFNLFKKDKNEEYQPLDEVAKAYYYKLQKEGINNNKIHRAGISFPEEIYEFLKLFAKMENKNVSEIVVDMVEFILENENMFDEFLKSKYKKKLR